MGEPSSIEGRPRVFLGTATVVPRRGLKKFFEDLRWNIDSDIEEELQQSLKRFFDLPPVHNVCEIEETDLGLDVIICNYSYGVSPSAIQTPYNFLLFWRPNVSLRARLYRLIDEQTIGTFQSQASSTVKEYILGSFRDKAMMGIDPVFGKDGLRQLLNRASTKLLSQVIQVAYK